MLKRWEEGEGRWRGKEREGEGRETRQNGRRKYIRGHKYGKLIKKGRT